MDFLLGIASWLSSLFELFFWYLGPFLMFGLIALLWEKTKHNLYNKALTYTIFGVLAAMILFPPWNNNVAGMEFSEGYNFITTYRHTTGMFINADQLLIQLIVALILGVSLQEFLSKLEKQI